MRRILLALIVTGLAAGGWLARDQIFPPAVTTAPVTRGAAAQIVYATGVVGPVRWAKVVALQRKRIVDICACEGRPVKKGEVLVRLDDAEERALLKELEARRKRIAGDIERVRALVERNAATRTSLDELITQAQEFDARITAQKDRIDDLQLRAPLDGVVLRKDGEIGEVAGTGPSDVLFWVGPPKPLRVVAEVSEDDVAKIRPGMRALLRTEAFPAGGLEASAGEITPKGDPATRTFRVYFALPDDSPLRIGMNVEINIVALEKPDVLLVPADAIVNGAVFVVTQNVLTRRAVITGIRGARQVEIVSGLEAGDLVVAPARTDLREGMRVRSSPASGNAK